MPSSGDRWLRHRVRDEDAGRTLQEVLVETLGVSRRMIQRLTRSTGILLNGRTAYLGRKVRAGDLVSARVQGAEVATLEPIAMPLQIIHEDTELLVVDKPTGMLVHPVGAGEPTLAHGVAHHWWEQGVRARVRPVHRLDRNTSGLVAFARSAHVHQALDRQLRHRDMHRSYLAVVIGAPGESEGTIDAAIGKHPSRTNLRVVTPQGGARAVTHFQVIETLDGAALLSVELETGRTHQIRAHLAHIGHPLLGDLRYGAPRNSGIDRQALHAARLVFDHPITHERLDLTSPLPADMEALLARLRV